MPETRLTVGSAGAALEARLQLPEGEGPFPAAVVCHPHPLYGGSMDNNVVAAISAGLRARGLAALLFNFRGVGASEGSPGDRAEALADVRAALGCAAGLGALDGARIGLAGYSFGSAVAAEAASPAVPALALVALPLSMAGPARGALAACAGPLLLLSGSADGGSGADGLRALAEGAGGPARVAIEPGADHFWRGHERAVADIVGGFFADALGGG